MKKLDKVDYYNLRKMLVEIYKCVSAWDNDDGKMAEANEKTPEDILAEFIEGEREEERHIILKTIADKINDEIKYETASSLENIIKFINNLW